MKKCIIIGGGLAGLSAAAHLVKNSHQVTLLEASPKLGGRTCSYFNTAHNHYTDNGQHLMMGCYHSTLELLKITDGMGEIEIQDKLVIPFVDNEGKTHLLNSATNLYPLNLLYAIMNYGALSCTERFSLLKFFIFNIFYNAGIREHYTVYDWLKKGGQSQNSILSLWKVLAVGTLNADIEKSSASLFRDVLRQIFFTGNKSAKMILTKNSLSETFPDKIRLFIHRYGGEIHLSERVSSISVSEGKITGIRSLKKCYEDFDCVISAVPLRAFNKLEFNPVKPEFIVPALEYSPIVSVHLWLKDNPFKERFYGMLDSEIDWLFNNGTHITLVKSAAGKLASASNEEIIRLFCTEIKKYFNYFDSDGVLDAVVIKEKNATFLPSPASNIERKNIYCPVPNLVLAGDWTDTRLPATIEGAIKSGKTAADVVMKM
jgi:squalene-associated FAD-dependent desaturase